MENEIKEIASKVASIVKLRFIIITVIFSFVFSFTKKLFLQYIDTTDVSALRIMGIIMILAIISEAFGIYLKTPFIARRSKVELPLGMFIFRLFTFFFLLMMGLGFAFCDSSGTVSTTGLGIGFFVGVIWAFVTWFIIDGRKNSVISDKHNYLETVADILLLIYSCVSITFTWELFMTSDLGNYILHFDLNVGKIITQILLFALFALMYVAANYMYWVERALVVKTSKDKLLIILFLVVTYLFSIK